MTGPYAESLEKALERDEIIIEKQLAEIKRLHAEIEVRKTAVEVRKTAVEKIYLEQATEIERLRAYIETLEIELGCGPSRALEPKP